MYFPPIIPPKCRYLLQRIKVATRHNRKIKIVTGAGLQFEKEILSPDEFRRSHTRSIRELSRTNELPFWEAHADIYWNLLENCRIKNWSYAPSPNYYFLYLLLSHSRSPLADVIVTTNYDTVWDAVLQKNIPVSHWTLNPVLREEEPTTPGYYAKQAEINKPIKLLKIHGSIDAAYASCCGQLYRLPPWAVSRPGLSLTRELASDKLHTFDRTSTSVHRDDATSVCANTQFLHYIDNNFRQYKNNLLVNDKRFKKSREPFKREIDIARRLLSLRPRPAGVIIAGFRAGRSEEVLSDLRRLTDHGIPVICLIDDRQNLSKFLRENSRRANCYVGTSDTMVHLQYMAAFLLDLNPVSLLSRYRADWIDSRVFIENSP